MISNQKSYDPPMHTAEHILNQTMVRLYNCGRSSNSHIEKKKSKCDYKLLKGLSEAEIAAIEKQVNDIINMHVAVTTTFISKIEAQEKYNLQRLPEDAGETLRIVHVGQYDSCPCSGIHVDNTSEIGSFRIISHSYENGIERIRFKLEEK
jgi:misacylated tRNA(Ala) deacylase